MIENITHIVTHGGRAHRDEIYSVAIVLAHLDSKGKFVRVYRRDPTTDEIEDPRVLVLDVGGLYEPDRMNLDHHGVVGQEDTCSIEMVAKYLGLLDKFRKLTWWRYLVLHDAKGASEANRAFGVNIASLMAINSPMETCARTMFSRLACFDVENPVYTFFVGFGRYLLSLLDFDAFVETMRANAVVYRIDNLGFVVFESATLEDVSVISNVRSRYFPGTTASIIPDYRGPGWTIHRYDDRASDVDFGLLRGRPGVRFVHNSGFMFTTTEKMPIEDLIYLISFAICDRG